MALRKEKDSKKAYSVELLLPHLDRLRKDAYARDVTMAALFELAIQQYCYDPETPHSPFSNDQIQDQRQKRKKIGFKLHTLSLRPTEILNIHNLAKLQQRPPKHVVEDSLSLFFGQTASSRFTQQTEPGIPKNSRIKGLFSEVKSRIQTTPKH